MMNKIIENRKELATKEDLDKIERIFDIILDKEYKNFLMKEGGGIPEKDIFDFKNIHKNEDSSDVLCFLSALYNSQYSIEKETNRLHEDRIPKFFIVIGLDSGGSFILMHKDSSIWFFDSENEFEWDGEEKEMEIKPNIYKIANKFKEFYNEKLYIDNE